MKLKLCPFCWDNATAFYSADTADWHTTCNGVVDEECRGIDNGLGYGHITERFAIEAWNRRNSHGAFSGAGIGAGAGVTTNEETAQ